MRILVIGGTRFIGPPLVRRLVSEGHEVAVFHRGQTHAELPGVRHFLGDRNQLARHAAELRGFGPQVVVDMVAFFESHAAGLVEVFRGVAERTIVLSSGDVYGAYGVFHGTEPGPIEFTPLNEDARLRGVLFPYRATAKGPDDLAYCYDKIPVERVVLGEPALPCTVLRLPMVYGPGDYQHRLYPYLKRMDDGRPVIVLDEGIARWRCTRGYVENIAASIALVATDPRAGPVYNLGEAVAFAEAEWVRQVGEVAGWRGEVVVVPRGLLPVPGDTGQDLVMDTSRIRDELGFREEIAAAEALRGTVEWERTHPPAEAPAFDYAAEDAFLRGVRARTT
jgi:nucleoside-diphosphate-sugar epimerase